MVSMLFVNGRALLVVVDVVAAVDANTSNCSIQVHNCGCHLDCFSTYVTKDAAFIRNFQHLKYLVSPIIYRRYVCCINSLIPYVMLLIKLSTFHLLYMSKHNK